MTRQVRIIAGACGYGAWPENTVESARRCLAAGVDGIEVDVHLSADGEVVACHDYRLDPDQARGPEGMWIDAPGALVRSLTLAELRRYDVGRSRPGSAPALEHPMREAIDGARIPTLAELIAVLAAAESRRELFVELKTNPQRPEECADPAALAATVLRVVDAAGYAEHTTAIAFDWRALRELARRAPHIRRQHLSIPASLQGAVERDAAGDSPWADGCDPRHFGGSVPHAIAAHGGEAWSVHFKELTPALVTEARAFGLGVAVWGVAARPDIDRMLATGVDWITVSGPEWGLPST
jgi:glycerophosphoryl diester phosphodiesterase